jgi:hypothetical protein
MTGLPSSEREDPIRKCVAETAKTRDWSSLRDLKEQIVTELGKSNAGMMPSQSHE